MASAFLEERWLPKSVLCLRDCNRHKFLLDLIAGITDQWRGKKKNEECRAAEKLMPTLRIQEAVSLHRSRRGGYDHSLPREEKYET